MILRDQGITPERVTSETVRLAGPAAGPACPTSSTGTRWPPSASTSTRSGARSRRRSARAPSPRRQPGDHGGGTGRAAGCAGPVRPDGRRPRQRRDACGRPAGAPAPGKGGAAPARGMSRSPPGPRSASRTRSVRPGPSTPGRSGWSTSASRSCPWPTAPSRPSCRRWAHPARGCEPRSSTVTGRPADSRRRLLPARSGRPPGGAQPGRRRLSARSRPVRAHRGAARRRQPGRALAPGGDIHHTLPRAVGKGSGQGGGADGVG